MRGLSHRVLLLEAGAGRPRFEGLLEVRDHVTKLLAKLIPLSLVLALILEIDPQILLALLQLD